MHHLERAGAEYMPQPDCVVVRNGIVDLNVLFDGKAEGVLTEDERASTHRYVEEILGEHTPG